MRKRADESLCLNISTIWAFLSQPETENKEISTDGGSIVENRPTERDPGGTVKLWGQQVCKYVGTEGRNVRCDEGL